MYKIRILLCLVTLSLSYMTIGAQAYAKQFKLRGKIIDGRSKKGISKIPFLVKPFNKKVVAGKDGAFLFNLPKGDYTFVIDHYPFNKKEVRINHCSDTTLVIELSSATESIYIPEVEIYSSKLASTLPSGIEQIDRKTLSVLPAFIGERDILKALAQTAGVSSSSEGAADLQVRGGTHGQNLYLLDGVPLYSTQHFFGMVSVYNPLIVKSAVLYKSSFPAEYGSKVSSVIDVLTDNANLSKFQGSVDISLLSSKLQMNIPIVKNKFSLAVSGRISNYSLLNISSIISPTSEGSKYNIYFGDINANMFWKMSEKDQMKITWFNNSDGFNITTRESIYITDSWIENAQRNIGVNWYRTVSQQTENHLLAYIDSYNFDFGVSNTVSNNSVKNINQMVTGINSVGLSDKFSSTINEKWKLICGTSFKTYGFTPFEQNVTDTSTNKIAANANLVRLSEIVAFSEMAFQFSPDHKLTTGLRFSVIGNSDNLFPNLEPRISYHGKYKHFFSISASLGRLTQPIHRLANPGLGIPFEIFMPSGNNVLPQTSWNCALGASKDFSSKKNTVSIKAELWYKTFQNIAEFKDGIDAISIMLYKLDISKDPNEFITQGNGKAYGIDLMGSITKKQWSLSADYTLMQAINQFESLNFGKPFAASTDIRHLLNMTLKRNISSNLIMIMTWQYRSGKPITMPTRIFQYPLLNIDNGELANSYVRFMPIVDERNNYRIKAFHKLDLSLTKEYLAFKRYNATLSLGVYNVYNRTNPYVYYLSKKLNSNGTFKPVLKSMQMFPIMPSFSWVMKF